jgi:hypothetical protein
MNTTSARVSIAGLFLMTTVVACRSSAAPAELSGWRFMTMSGSVVSVVMAPDGLSIERTHVTERKVECAAKGATLCIKSDAFDIVMPETQPKLGQQWSVDYLTFTELREIPSLLLLGQVYHRVRVIRREKRWADGAVTTQDLYYSNEAGLLGFWTHGGELFLATQIPSLSAGGAHRTR